MSKPWCHRPTLWTVASGVATFLAFSQLFTVTLMFSSLWLSRCGGQAGPSSLMASAALILLPRLVGSVIWGDRADRYGPLTALRTCLAFSAATSAVVSLFAVRPPGTPGGTGIFGALVGLSAFTAGGMWPISAVLCASSASAQRRGRAGLSPQLGVLAAVIAAACFGLLVFRSPPLVGVNAWIATSHAALAVAMFGVRRTAGQAQCVRQSTTRADPMESRPHRATLRISRRSWRRLLLAGAALSTTFAVFGMATAPVVGIDARADQLEDPRVAAALATSICALVVAGTIAAIVSDALPRQLIVLVGTSLTAGAALCAALLEPDASPVTVALLAIPAALPFGCGAALLPALFPPDHRSVSVGIASALGAAGGAVASAVATAVPSSGPGDAPSPVVVAVVGTFSALCIVAVIRDTARE